MGWDGTYEGASSVNSINNTRNILDYNMLVFIVQDISNSQNVYIDAIGEYLNYVTYYFEILIIGLSIFLMISVFLIIICMLNTQILKPIHKLTEHILGTNKNIDRKLEIEK